MATANTFLKYCNCCKIITLKLMFFFVFSALHGAETNPQNYPNTPSKQKLKFSQQFKNRMKSTDSVNVIDLGKIFIAPPIEGKVSKLKHDSPYQELHKLNQERMEILKTLKRLEDRMNKRKKRKKRPSRRPCV
ncbi:MAG: hypothetical protein Q9P90_00475 [candidate division KSB1 bacterium]|nr:hypothetical protein [candidate division KSB1 bacterium]